MDTADEARAVRDQILNDIQHPGAGGFRKFKLKNGNPRLSPNAIGKAGEEAVQGTYNIGSKVKIRVNGRGRIPDGLTDDVLSEVKNVQSLSFTKQLRDFSTFAQMSGRRFDLYVRASTKLSKPLQEAIKSGKITLKTIPKK